MKQAGVSIAVDTPADVNVRRPARALRTAFLIGCDSLALALSGALAYALWALPVKGQSIRIYLELLPLVSLFVVAYAQSGLYPGFGLGPVETLRRMTYATVFSFLVVAAFSFALKLPPLYSRVTFSLAFVLSLVVLPLFRALIFRWAARWDWWPEPVIVVGIGERAARAIRRIKQARQFGYRPVAVLSHAGLETSLDLDVEGVPLAGGIERAAALAAQGIRTALLETRRHDPARERPMVDRLQRDFRHVVLIREYGDLPVEGLQIRNLGNMVGIEYTNNLLLYGNQLIKRGLDIIVAGVLAIISAPIALLAAAAVWLIDRGPILFVQDRAGRDGKRIAVPKIRTMRRDAEQRLEEHLAADPAARQEWANHYKLKNDPRLVPIVGRWIRHFSIDEIPQLWTVLRGDMSLVGPRPFPDYHLKTFTPRFLELRLRVRPGITGIWQVSVRSAGTTTEQESYDGYYIRNWSVWLDLYVLARTIVAVLSGKGAY